MSLEIFRARGTSAKPAELTTGRVGGDLLVSACTKELADPKTTGIAGSLSCR